MKKTELFKHITTITLLDGGDDGSEREESHSIRVLQNEFVLSNLWYQRKVYGSKCLSLTELINIGTLKVARLGMANNVITPKGEICKNADKQSMYTIQLFKSSDYTPVDEPFIDGCVITKREHPEITKGDFATLKVPTSTKRYLEGIADLYGLNSVHGTITHIMTLHASMTYFEKKNLLTLAGVHERKSHLYPCDSSSLQPKLVVG